MGRLPLVNFAIACLLSQAFLVRAAIAPAGEARDGLAYVNISPLSVSFGTVQSGSYIRRSEQFSNTGSVPILVYATSVHEAGFDFNCPSLPIALRPHSTLLCNVGFHPRLAGQYRGRMIVWIKWRDRGNCDEQADNGEKKAGFPHLRRCWNRAARTIEVTGLASDSAGIVSPFPSSIKFDQVQVSRRKSVLETLANRGQSALTISRVVALGAGFSFSGINPPLTLSPGQSVSFVVSYAPTLTGVSTGSLTIDSNASNRRLSLMLLGSAFSPGQLRVSSRAMNFGNVVVGTSQKQVETLFAVGGPVTVSSVNTNNAEFAVGGISLPKTIPSGGTASVILTFSPHSPGTSTGMLGLVSSADNSLAKVPIAGTGTSPLQHSVILGWDPSPSDSVVGYNIYRSTQSGGPYSRINSDINTSNTETDDNVVGGQTYYYVVTTLTSDSGESTYSNEARAVVPSP